MNSTLLISINSVAVHLIFFFNQLTVAVHLIFPAARETEMRKREIERRERQINVTSAHLVHVFTDSSYFKQNSQSLVSLTPHWPLSKSELFLLAIISDKGSRGNILDPEKKN
ncbi:hypothetical protein LWI28_016913 [Acer negundo]|uniref:Uncharacterized protein n=1 Tax=Acer negundo TaxID=4023 RepID=A0AAD5IJM2_ACENE|nr:hypothetical protein LWI28_016913 [Acer negundo]KAK4840668.1 hypothetical protein QYF36_015272 [Acer negundo]